MVEDSYLTKDKRICSECETSATSKWYRDKKDGWLCITCYSRWLYRLNLDKNRIYARNRYRNSPEVRARNKKACKQYYQRNKEKIKERDRIRCKLYYDAHREEGLLSRWKYRHETRLALLRLISSDGVHLQCVSCGYNTDIRALVADHIHNDGYLDKKRFRTNLVAATYYLKHPEEAKQKLQILCCNCNQIKASSLEGLIPMSISIISTSGSII